MMCGGSEYRSRFQAIGRVGNLRHEVGARGCRRTVGRVPAPPVGRSLALRQLALSVTLLAIVCVFPANAADTNYFCLVCGKGPLSGHIWLHERGAICDDCKQLPDHCSLCGLPVKAEDGHLKTGDGRFICQWDKPNVILTLDQAKELFSQTRDAAVALLGRQFELKNPEVTVTLFDVDYWSEKGQANGLHKFGFASSRPAGGGGWTHEVVLLSGRLRTEMQSVAAHEYTHLWINENCPASHHIEGDTVEAICELTAYKLMQHEGQSAMQQRILENSYTRGKIKDVLAVEREGGTDYVLNWVKTSMADQFDPEARLTASPVAAPPAPYVPGPRVLPAGLTFSGTLAIGKEQLAVINGEAFAAGDQRNLKLRGRTVRVRCLHWRSEQVEAEVDGQALTLERGEEKNLP